MSRSWEEVSRLTTETGSGCHVLRSSAFVLMLNYHPPSGGRGISLAARPAVSVRPRRAIEWGGHTHPPCHHASAPETLDLYSHLAVHPFASSFISHLYSILLRVSYICRSVCVCASAFGDLLARCHSPHPRSVFHFIFFVHSCLVTCAGLAYRRVEFAALCATARRLYFAFHFRFSASLHSKFLKALYTSQLFRFFRFVLYVPASQAQKDTSSLSRPKRAGAFRLRRW
jgi:hypothetical protein